MSEKCDKCGDKEKKHYSSDGKKWFCQGCVPAPSPTRKALSLFKKKAPAPEPEPQNELERIDATLREIRDAVTVIANVLSAMATGGGEDGDTDKE